MLKIGYSKKLQWLVYAKNINQLFNMNLIDTCVIRLNPKKHQQSRFQLPLHKLQSTENKNLKCDK